MLADGRDRRRRELGAVGRHRARDEAVGAAPHGRPELSGEGAPVADDPCAQAVGRVHREHVAVSDQRQLLGRQLVVQGRHGRAAEERRDRGTGDHGEERRLARARRDRVEHLAVGPQHGPLGDALVVGDTAALASREVDAVDAHVEHARSAVRGEVEASSVRAEGARLVPGERRREASDAGLALGLRRQQVARVRQRAPGPVGHADLVREPVEVRERDLRPVRARRSRRAPGPGCDGSSRVRPAAVTACRYGPEPSSAGPLARKTVPSGCHALPASVNPGGVTSTRLSSPRLKTSIPRDVSSAIRNPSGANEANVQSSRIVLDLEPVGRGKAVDRVTRPLVPHRRHRLGKRERERGAADGAGDEQIAARESPAQRRVRLGDVAECILLLHSSAGLYGADRQLLAIASGLDRRRFEPVAVLPERGELAGPLEEAGVETVVAPLTVLRRAGLGPRAAGRLIRPDVRELEALARARKAALVHSNTSVIVSGGRVAKRLGVPHVLHVRELYPRVPLAWPLWRRRLLAADRLLCVSRAVAAQFGGSERVAVVHDGVPRPPRRAERAAARSALGLDANSFAVAVLGRVSSWKGQDVLARALAEQPLASIGAVGLVAGTPWPGADRPGRRARAAAREPGSRRPSPLARLPGRRRHAAGRRRRGRGSLDAAGPLPKRGPRGRGGRRSRGGSGARRAARDVPRRRDGRAGRAGRPRRACRRAAGARGRPRPGAAAWAAPPPPTWPPASPSSGWSRRSRRSTTRCCASRTGRRCRPRRSLPRPPRAAPGRTEAP